MELYPPIEPYDCRRVPVDGRHTLHVEQAGNPDGVPVVFLHGGPGLAWSRAIYRFFDPGHYRIVAFDQRGTDRSTPLGELRDNTTAHLMADIEHLRGLLGIDRWIVFGGSWGSALALAYALHHRERVTALVVRGIYLGEPEDDIFAFTQCRRIFPQAWHALAAHFPEADHGDLFHAIARDLDAADPARAMAVARAYGAYAEVLCNNASAMSEVPDREMGDEVQLAAARISFAYFANAIFLPPCCLGANMARLAGLPGAIAHGAADVICPPLNAWRLAQAWPDAELTIAPRAGHSPFEEGTRQALVAAMERLKGIS